MNKIKACLFDCYGTLIDIKTDESDANIWKAMKIFYDSHGAIYKAEELCHLYWMMSKDICIFREETYEFEMKQIFQHLFAYKGIAASDWMNEAACLIFRFHSLRRLQLYPYAKQLLSLLRSHYQIFLLSNAQYPLLRWEMSVLGLSGYFDHCYISSTYHVKKPDKRFYDILLKQEKLSPDHCLMIGNDASSDIVPARDLGMKTCLFNSGNLPEQQTISDLHIHSLDELISVMTEVNSDII